MLRHDRRVAVFLAALLPVFGLSAKPQDPAELERDLAQLRAQIERIQARIDADLEQRENQQRALADAERALADAGKARHETRRRLAQTAGDIETLEGRIDSTSASVDDIGERLSAQLRLIHHQGTPSGLQLLLNQQDPRRLRRHLAYHGHLSRQRLALIEDLQGLQQSLIEDRRDLERELARLAELEASQIETAARIEQERAKRDRALREIDERIASGSERIDELCRDAEELEALIEELAQALKAVPMDVEVPSILDLAGTLAPPLEGRLVQSFGDPRGGEMRWAGWLMEAPAGAQVRAIAHGRVAYADWLRGYGMLAIIDHGDGVMSLYGHNETLLKDVGSWVNPGDVIASVGRSGGADRDALYFEIRRDGEPVDPSDWLTDP
ncbi:murein hydrolase activator EnvC family protein [Wenzhouxiangella limi]|uniref:Peptidoglycan DD-metalloendopeptidase family protein n=1 Tax=Wenzhouxiangella limi TaxID=2707351 RepID=A0A845V3H0_9GAMM|nr:peptidoglycan DD-metalloendopeptidase family protein [Wenzhouxiangella limi]NDY94791.1 peptidoglycan DD-metalloendopeptidase family protein [Wenzhouxiangella limi]